MITEEQRNDAEFCKNLLIAEIEKVRINAGLLKDHIEPDAMIPIIYLKMFSAYLSEKKFESLEDAWRFMVDIKGIIEKISYVNSNFGRISESIKAKSSK